MKFFSTAASLLAATAPFAFAAQTAQDDGVIPNYGGFQYPRLIQTENSIKMMNEAEIFDLVMKRVGFMDITDTVSIESGFLPDVYQSTLPFTRSVRNPNKFFDQIDTAVIAKFITDFSQFHNRFFRSQYGVQSAEWLFTELQKVADAAHSGLRVTVSKIEHQKWPQPSIVIRVEPKEGTDGDLTIISAHQDCTVGYGSATGRAPGADDNASGSSVAYMVYKILTSTPEFVPSTPLEFHWYAAEEGGLLGSQEVALSRRRSAQKIYGVLHFDMTGYNNGKNIIGITTDFTDNELTEYLRGLVRKYTKLQPVDSKCGYACSDHASWTKNGYRAAFPMETTFKESNPDIHTGRDTLDKLSLDHMKEFVALGLAYVIEMTDGEKY